MGVQSSCMDMNIFVYVQRKKKKFPFDHMLFNDRCIINQTDTTDKFRALTDVCGGVFVCLCMS